MFTIDGQDRLKHNNRLVTRVMSPNTNGAFADTPAVTVMHFTFGASGASSAEWFRNPDNTLKSSAHIVVNRDGSVIQCVDFGTGSNHAGRSSWRGRSGLNRWSFGIELANWGYLQRRGANWTSWTGTVVPDAIEAVHRNGNPDGSHTPIGWEPYPEEQIRSAVGIVQAIAERYGAQEIIGHDDIAPTRKWDPGPAFDMADFRRRVGEDLSSNEPHVLLTDTPGDTLNLRSGPGMAFAVLHELADGTAVTPVEADGNWLLVNVLNQSGTVVRTGWIFGRLTRPA